MPDYGISYDTGVDWGTIQRAVQLRNEFQQAERERKAQAIRWQGQQDYQTMVQSGIEPLEAMKRTAGKLFYDDPRGLASVIEQTRKAAAPAEPATRTVNGVQFYWDGNSWAPLPNQGPSPGDFVDVTSQTPTGEVIKRKVPRTQYEQAQAAMAASNEAAAQSQAAQPGMFGSIWNKLRGVTPAPVQTPITLEQALRAPAGATQAQTQQTTETPQTGQAPQKTKTDFQSAPKNPKDREAGKTYMTPKGPAIWRGNGWELVDKFSSMPRDVSIVNAGIRG